MKSDYYNAFEDGVTFGMIRRFHANSSSIRKIGRMKRIQEGLRPFKIWRDGFNPTKGPRR